MRPFLELPIVIGNSEGKEKQVTARILPDEIEYFYPGFNEGTVIVMKSRSSFITMFNEEEFDNILSAYHKTIKDHPGKFGNIKLTPKEKSIMHVTH
ncbi:MAG TPA: hypothetical protein VMZ03_03825 [Chitinophagaceae bacterium]|nr:hypothetical protein [Chitinophagaceae bacterium]